MNTPIEIVDFILHSVAHLVKQRFGISLADRTVAVIDLFTSSGEFLTRLLELGLLNDMSQEHKNSKFLHKTTDQYSTTYVSSNAQRRLRVRVIVGNLPHSTSQQSYVRGSKNVSYQDLDARINATYLTKARVITAASLHDSYIRALRWASDQVGDAGIIAVITNAGFLMSEAGSGIRASLAEEFNEIWCFDLRGNARTQGERRRKEGDGVFGTDSRASAAIIMLVKYPNAHGCTIRYHDIGDYLTREQKLSLIQRCYSVDGIRDWQNILPDKYHDWLDQRRDDFAKHLPLSDKGAQNRPVGLSVFETYSYGVITGRDSWVCNSSKDKLADNMSRTIAYCNKQNLNKPTIDPKQVKWGAELRDKLSRLESAVSFDDRKIRVALYRPFFKQWLYFDHTFNNRLHLIPKFFPARDSNNLVICITYKSTGVFSALATDVTPDAYILPHACCFPFFIYDNDDQKYNISDSTMSKYWDYYSTKSITKHDLFYYVYGILHHYGYRRKFANNLTRELPRIPMAPDFAAFSSAGQQLADLHLGYETCKRHDLGRPKFSPTKFTKLSFGWKKDGEKKVRDRTVIRADGAVLFDNVPETSYRVNGRTPVEWIVDRYRVTIDKESGITNDPCTGTDIVAVIERAVHVGLESERIIKSLPKEFEP